VTNAGSGGSCYSNPALDALIKDANTKPLASVVDKYKQAGQMLIDDSVAGNLVYGIQQYVVPPVGQGCRRQCSIRLPWSDVRILQHT